MKLINDLKALGVTLSDEKIVAKMTDLGLQNSDLSDSEVKELAVSMGAGNLAIASESQIAAPTKSTKGRKSKAIAPVQVNSSDQSSRVSDTNASVIQQSAMDGFNSPQMAAAGQAFVAGCQARFSAEVDAGLKSFMTNLSTFGQTNDEQVAKALEEIVKDWTVEPEGKSLDFWE
jgi:hypothetical protein